LSSTLLDSKRTKIVATIGPASSDEATLRAIIRGGMNVARINFSHGDHATHGANIDRIRRIAAELDEVVAIMCDLQGPKIRIGRLPAEPLLLEKGARIRLTLDAARANHAGDGRDVGVPNAECMRDVHGGMPRLLDEGNREFLVTARDAATLTGEVVGPGALYSRKGVTAPTASLSLSAITDKDRHDLDFALAKETDFVAMSFVRRGHDLRELRQLIAQTNSGHRPWLVAKIEKLEALQNIEDIIAESDGIMVARGDLGVETPAEEVPGHQKHIIRLCNLAGKPVITATQMLNSMIDSPRPTRAEASDVYNAIMDGSDAVMLSNETAVGAYPVVSVETMAGIAVIAEQALLSGWTPGPVLSHPEHHDRERISDAISEATSQIAAVLDCKAIVTSTHTGYTAQQIARERSRTPILCVTPSEHTFRRMALVWGVIPMLVPDFSSTDEMIGTVVRAANRSGMVERGDRLVLIAGVPFGIGGQTNFLKVHVVGEADEL